jgi:hypothetical protein
MESVVRDLHFILFILVGVHEYRWKEKRTFCSITNEILSKCVPPGILSFLDAFRKIVKSDCYLHHVCLSVRMEQLDSRWTDFHNI